MHPGRPAAELYLRAPLRLEGPGRFRLRAPRLPAPLHALAALLLARDCTLAERRGLVRAFAAWKRSDWTALPGQTVDALLAGQSPRMVARLWAPLCLSALNTPPARASAQVYLNVLRDSLAADRAASDLVIPLVDLSALFPDAAARAIEALGGSVRRKARVTRIGREGDMVIVRIGGATLACNAAIIATAPWQAPPLLEENGGARTAISAVEAYEYEPISTIHLRYPRAVRAPSPMVQLAGTPGQWLFDVGRVVAGEACMGVVISADGPHRALAHDALVACVAAQLAANFPAFANVRPTWSRVITERRATHACTPARAHPLAGELAPGIHLAGDHASPDYPATLEAACRSGIRAARAVHERL